MNCPRGGVELVTINRVCFDIEHCAECGGFLCVWGRRLRAIWRDFWIDGARSEGYSSEVILALTSVGDDYFLGQ